MIEPPSFSSTLSTEQLQKTIECLQADLVASQRLALLGTMSAMVAHEINNLMTPILARAEFALSTGSPADMRRTVERSKAHVQRAIAVTEQLLGLAQGAKQPPQPCSVSRAVQEAIAAIVRPLDKDGIELVISVPENLHVHAHFDLLEQVLLNLLLNAQQAMQGMRGCLRISAQSDGDHIIIEVRDAGRGLPADQIENTINPFLAAPYSTEPRAWQSVGLGLNVCRMIVQQHAATIQAEANEGPGCTIRLRWPAAPSPN
ncbi:MAG: HAMP domain-containing sensor histidine kinase [Planctomycetota bacterium]